MSPFGSKDKNDKSKMIIINDAEFNETSV